MKPAWNPPMTPVMSMKNVVGLTIGQVMWRKRAHQPAPTLSGGQQQMVAIGRALITNPRLLLCDEISLGLSPAAVRDVYAAIGEIKKRGTTIVLVEQDLNAALGAADRIYCFLEGRVSLVGRTDEFDHAQILAAYFGT